MEWNDRLSTVRKAAGLTQEQLGELVGVTRQAVSKWESAQAVPDALVIAAICRALHVSADYILLGEKPEEDGTEEPMPLFPDRCPCCGRETSGGICISCGYVLASAAAPQGPRYAVVGSLAGPVRQADQVSQVMKYCGLSPEEIDRLNGGFSCEYPWNQAVFCRERDARAAQWIAFHLAPQLLPRIVQDCGEGEELLRVKPAAMDVPTAEQPKPGGIGFWGTVGAVILGIIAALLILSVF